MLCPCVVAVQEKRAITSALLPQPNPDAPPVCACACGGRSLPCPQVWETKAVSGTLTAAVKLLQAMVETDGSSELPVSVRRVVQALTLIRDEARARGSHGSPVWYREPLFCPWACPCA